MIPPVYLKLTTIQSHPTRNSNTPLIPTPREKEHTQSALSDKSAAAAEAAQQLADAKQQLADAKAALAAATALAEEREREISAARHAAEAAAARHEEAAREAAGQVGRGWGWMGLGCGVGCDGRGVASFAVHLLIAPLLLNLSSPPQISQLERQLVHSQDDLAAKESEVRWLLGHLPALLGCVFKFDLMPAGLVSARSQSWGGWPLTGRSAIPSLIPPHHHHHQLARARQEATALHDKLERKRAELTATREVRSVHAHHATAVTQCRHRPFVDLPYRYLN